MTSSTTSSSASSRSEQGFADVTVVGAGFSGLACAYYLLQQDLKVEIIEATRGPGGLIRSSREAWGLVESAANAFRSSQALDHLTAAIGAQLQAPKRESRKRYIFRGKARRWPLNFGESFQTLKSYLFSKQRAPLPGESVHDWGARVLGEPAAHYLLEAALQGIYAGDPKRMSASLILARFFDPAEKAKKKAQGRRATKSVAPKEGMGFFMLKLSAYLRDQGVQIHYGKKLSAEELKALPAPVVVCTSASDAAHLLAEREPELSQELSQVEMVSLTTVTLAFAHDPRELKGFGCLYPDSEGFESLGTLFNDSIFRDRSESRSETWILRGSGEATSHSDAEVLAKILKDRERLLGYRQEPRGYKITRWPRGLPHYTVELEKLLGSETFSWAEQRGVFLEGNYLGRLGLSQILDHSAELSVRIKRFVQSRSPDALYADASLDDA